MPDTPSGYGPPDAQPPRRDNTPETGGPQAGGPAQPAVPSSGPEPGPAPSSPDGADESRYQAAFEALVSRFDDEPAERRWPAAEDIADPHRPPVVIIRPATRPLDRTGPADTGPADTEPTDTGPADTEPTDPDETDPGPADPAGSGRADEAARSGPPHGPASGGDQRSARTAEDGGNAGREDGRDDEGHYEPPPPPPVPRMRPVTRWALGSIALGVAILVVPALIGLDRARSHDVAGVFLILGGVGTLIARMGERPPTDSDDPDDGAVV